MGIAQVTRVCEASHCSPGKSVMLAENASSTICIKFFTAVASRMHANLIQEQDDNCRGKKFTLT
jgi:3,4-dihydroxy-2-butanone 4-phosphate synthase